MTAARKDNRADRAVKTSKKLERKSQTEPMAVKPDAPNPVWFKPIMFGFMLLGLVWVIVYYVTSTTLVLPVPALGQNNLFLGLGLVLIGFFMTPFWK